MRTANALCQRESAWFRMLRDTVLAHIADSA